MFILVGLISQGELDDDLVTLFLTETAELTNIHPNPASKWLTDKSWAEVIRASQSRR